MTPTYQVVGPWLEPQLPRLHCTCNFSPPLSKALITQMERAGLYECSPQAASLVLQTDESMFLNFRVAQVSPSENWEHMAQLLEVITIFNQKLSGYCI